MSETSSHEVPAPDLTGMQSSMAPQEGMQEGMQGSMLPQGMQEGMQEQEGEQEPVVEPYTGPLTLEVLELAWVERNFAPLLGREKELQVIWRKGETRYMRALAGLLYKGVSRLRKAKAKAEQPESPQKKRRKRLPPLEEDPEELREEPVSVLVRAAAGTGRKVHTLALTRKGLYDGRVKVAGTISREDLTAQERHELFRLALYTLRVQLRAMTSRGGRPVPDNLARQNAAKELLIFLGARPIAHARRQTGPDRVKVQVAQFAGALPEESDTSEQVT